MKITARIVGRYGWALLDGFLMLRGDIGNSGRRIVWVNHHFKNDAVVLYYNYHQEKETATTEHTPVRVCAPLVCWWSLPDNDKQCGFFLWRWKRKGDENPWLGCWWCGRPPARELRRAAFIILGKASSVDHLNVLFLSSRCLWRHLSSVRSRLS
jgi:hypothetical protein